jgi:exosortase/archaeosortase family protein
VIKKHTVLKGIIIKGILLYALWIVMFHSFGVGKGGFDEKMSIAIGESVTHVLTYFGANVNSYKGEYLDFKGENIYHLGIGENDIGVIIGNRCNGLLISVLYIGFFMVFPGKTLPKIVFAIGGLILLTAANIARIIALLYNHAYHYISFEFNHKYTYSFLMYSIIFLLWMYWVNHYSDLSIKKNNDVQIG